MQIKTVLNTILATLDNNCNYLITFEILLFLIHNLLIERLCLRFDIFEFTFAKECNNYILV